MKTTILSLAIASMTIAPFCQAEEQYSTESIAPTYGTIDAEGLLNLINSNTPVVVIDARGNQWTEPNKIPGAHMASSEDSEADFEAIIPNKESLVVVYCYSITCPKGPRLTARLLQLGYKNIIVYHEGLKEWRDSKHFPVETLQR
jgi:rhodanese-related sulfurtransferase